MQTIDLCDEVTVEEGGRGKEEGGWVRVGSSSLLVEGDHEASVDDLTLRAVRALEEVVGRELPVAIRLVKRIPVAAGLGGGSSDAAAVLRAVDTLLSGRIGESKQMQVAGQLGSDVAFFLRGGTTSVAGRGEQVKAVLYGTPMWIVLLRPPISLPDKTKVMYASLTESDYSDGSRTVRLVQSLRSWRPRPVDDTEVFNVFDRVAYEVFDGLDRYRERFLRAGASAVHLAGAGPSLFAIASDEDQGRAVAARMAETGGSVFVVRTLGLWDATRVEVVDGE
jgi:4-diphosphocytidyl-2-C-methyl-D-erythritol kinase